MKQRLLASIALLIAAICWGASFLFIQTTMSHDILWMIGIRLSFAALMVYLLSQGKCLAIPKGQKQLWAWMGFLMALTFVPQAFGLQGTSVANSSVITSMFVVFTPIVMFGMGKQRPRFFQWIGAVVGISAFIILGSAQGFSKINIYDALTFLTALAVAIHAVLYGEIVNQKGALLSVVFYQFFIGALICFGLHALDSARSIETALIPTLSSSEWAAIGFLGIISTAVPYLLQAYSQKVMSPVQVVLIISSEPFWAMAIANLVRGDVITGAALIACALLIFANLISELKTQNEKKRGAH